MNRTLRRCLLVLGLSLLFIHTTAPSVSAAWYFRPTKEYLDIMDAAGESGNVQQEGYSYSFTNAVVNGLIVDIGGFRFNPESGFYYKKSVLGYVNEGIGVLYQTPPANTVAFIQDMGQSLGFIPQKAYAQGIGFRGLEPVLGLWKAFRNIAYLLLSLVLVAVGFMVMFRKQIDPKTVVTIQNSLPRIVLTLILITFSYAIAALLIDFMYLSIALSAQVIGGADVIDNTSAAQLQEEYTQATTGTLWDKTNDPAYYALDQTTQDLGARVLKEAFSTKNIVALFQLKLDKVLEGGLRAILTLVSPLWSLLVLLIMLAAFIRLLITLITCYINVVVSILLGPFQLLTEAVPGGNGFSGWIKNLVGNLMAFPVTAVFFMISSALIDNLDQQLWTPPFLPNYADSLAKAFITIGIVISIPSVINSIKESMKSKPMIQAGPAMAAGSVSAGVGMGYQVVQFLQQRRMIDAMKNKFGKNGDNK